MARTIQGTIVLSNIQHLRWSMDEANLSIEEAETLLKKWHKQDQDHAEWNDLYLWTQRSKGELLLSLGRYDEASQTLRKGILNYKYTSSETSDYNITIHDYVLSYCALSKISQMIDKKLVSEKTLHDMRANVSDILNRHSSFIEGKYLISTIDFCLGDLAKENKKLNEALARYASGIETLSSLVLDHPDDVQWQWDLAMAKMSESFIQAKAGKAEAHSRYEGAREALKKIQMANPSLIQWQKSFEQLPAFPEVKK